MDISSYSLFLFIITTLLYVSSVPIIGKPPLILINNNGNFTLTDDDIVKYYTDCMFKMGIFLLIVICTQLSLNI